MKTRKILLLSAAMLLSIGAFAQGDGIKHRFPQLNYTSSDGKTKAFIPAWDVQMYDEGAMPGCVRLQITEIISEDVAHPENSRYKCKIVYRQGILEDLSDFHYTTSSSQVVFTGFSKSEDYSNNGTFYVLDDNGNLITETVKKLAGKVQYSDFIDINTYDKGTWFEGTDYKHQDYDVFNFKDSGRHYVYGNYVIPETYSNKYGTFEITDIDMFAFRNNVTVHASEADKLKYWFRPTSVTIPATINSIGYGAFLNNTSTTTITFDSESPIKEIPPRTFMNCAALKTVTLPASVEKIWGASFGGCTNLEKIIFTGEEAPELKDYTHTNGQNYNFITATSATFPGLTAAKCIMEVPLHSAKKYAEKDDLYKQFVMSSKFPMDYDMITYCSDLEFTFKQYDASQETWSDGGPQVYFVDYGGIKPGSVTMTEITENKKIPATNFGVLLRGTQGETYDIFYPNNLIQEKITYQENSLIGVIAPKDIDPTTSQNKYYVLRPDGKFHLLKQSGTLGANKAYLLDGDGETDQIGTGSIMSVTLPGDETGIEILLVEDETDDAVYTLQGTKVSQPHKGLVIKNGKKYIVK